MTLLATTTSVGSFLLTDPSYYRCYLDAVLFLYDNHMNVSVLVYLNIAHLSQERQQVRPQNLKLNGALALD